MRKLDLRKGHATNGLVRYITVFCTLQFVSLGYHYFVLHHSCRKMTVENSTSVSPWITLSALDEPHLTMVTFFPAAATEEADDNFVLAILKEQHENPAGSLENLN